ncbi:rRNA maturation RNase YbeY [candidate division WS5 bacterium]|uniref:Endoribonuclease YbeY n=1 Tax=candidate division WS5 bacterium TaxID=2093353 RepID=A0A419DE79_9BACT|nr:MAG: rRNA maturation RNase YbeY [candidate division WS5 bacterium]
MAKVNIVGEYKKTGLTEQKIRQTVEAVFDFLNSSLSSRAQVEGSIKKMDSHRSLSAGEIPASAGMTKESAGITKDGGNYTRASKTINIAFVEAGEIRELNKDYRKKDSPTDVLSFDYRDEGDMILCIDQIDELKDSQETLPEAILKTMIHGALHLFGFDHEKAHDRDIMRKAEEEIYLHCHSREGGDL